MLCIFFFYAKLTWLPWYSWNIAESGVKTPKINQINTTIHMTKRNNNLKKTCVYCSSFMQNGLKFIFFKTNQVFFLSFFCLRHTLHMTHVQQREIIKII